MFEHKPLAYWNELRRNNPPKYYSLKSLKQMQESCIQLGLSAFLTTAEGQANDLRW